MDLEEFYCADERRRASPELELGRDWHDARGARFELSWVEDTGELYAMREPAASPAWLSPFGDWVSSSLPDQALTVRVLGHLATKDDVHRVLAGWQEAMSSPDSIRWALEALHQAGVRPADAPGPG